MPVQRVGCVCLCEYVSGDGVGETSAHEAGQEGKQMNNNATNGSFFEQFWAACSRLLCNKLKSLGSQGNFLEIGASGRRQDFNEPESITNPASGSLKE